MKVTKAIKEKIVFKAITASGLFARREENEKRLSEWLELARLDAVGGADAEAKVKRIVAEFRASVEALPAKAKELVIFPEYCTHSEVRLNVCGQRHFTGYKNDHGKRQSRISRSEITVPADSALGAKWVEIQNEKDDIDTAIKVITANIGAVLSQATTVAKLLAVWPEANAYLPEPEKKAVQTLPAVPIDLINNQIKSLAGGAPPSTVK